MKKRFLFTVMLLTTMIASSQTCWPWPVNECFGHLVDQASLAPLPNPGAPASTILVASWDEFQEQKVTEGLEDLEQYYGKRRFFIMHNAEVALKLLGEHGVVESKIHDMSIRIEAINIKNNTTTFYFPYKQDNNTHEIDHIRHANDKIRNSLLPISEYTPMVGGEKINLQQNLEISLETLHRRLDSIESNIDNSAVLKNFIDISF